MARKSGTPKASRSRAGQKKRKRPVSRRRSSPPAAKKKISFKFTGTWDEWDASVDDDELQSPVDSRDLSAGDYTLYWELTGRPGATYGVSIAGCSPADWSRDDLRFDDQGRGLGTQPFKVTIP